MANSREFDIILFGATGFTGKHAIPYVRQFADANNLKWAVGGRSEDKLKQVLAQVDAKIAEIPVVIASVEDSASLASMAARTRLVINCCGPYRFFGEAVVRACVEQGAHHVDVSGEPQFMEKMQLEYDRRARDKGVYVVSACGLDSIPADLGVVFLSQKFGGVVNSVNTYLEMWSENEAGGPMANYGTWESAVYGLAHMHELKGIRSKLYPERTPKFTPTLQAKSLPHKNDLVEGWVLPFLGSDKAVVRRSQRFFYDNKNQRPIQVETYFTIKSLLYVILGAFFGAIFKFLCNFDFGRKLLLNNPALFSFGIFSKDPPSEEKIQSSWFSVTLAGEGWKDKLTSADDVYASPCDKFMVVKVKGRNPGYGATCLALVLAGVVILTEPSKLPPGGGVLPPGAAFADTSLIKQLHENGLTFEVVTEKELK